jgi:hypothetical protein
MGQVRRLLTPRNAAAGLRSTCEAHVQAISAGSCNGQVLLATGALVTRREREAQMAQMAQMAAEFLSAPEPLHNACWIAEQDGVSVGAIA